MLQKTTWDMPTQLQSRITKHEYSWIAVCHSVLWHYFVSARKCSAKAKARKKMTSQMDLKSAHTIIQNWKRIVRGRNCIISKRQLFPKVDTRTKPSNKQKSFGSRSQKPQNKYRTVFKVPLTFIPSRRFNNTRETTYLGTFRFTFAFLLFFDNPKNYF